MAMCLLLLGVLFGAVVPLATVLRSRTTRRTDELRARLAFDTGVATIRSQSLAMTLVIGSTLNVSVNGVTGTLTTASNGSLANSLLVTGTMLRNGQSYRYSRVIGARQPTPYSFAFFSNADAVLKKATTGASGVDGDIFSNGTLTIQTPGSVVNGNMMAVGAISPGSSTVTGRQLTGQTAIAWPTIQTSDYLLDATAQSLGGYATIYLLNTTFNSVALPSSTYNGKYYLDYFTFDLSLSGSMTGKGVLYVNGNLTITGNLSYSNSSSEVAIIVKGNVTVNNSVSNVQGYIFCGGTFSHGQNLVMSRGTIVANNYSTTKDITIVRDNFVRDNNDEGAKLRLPYYWP